MKKVLFIEDEEKLSKLIKEELENAGYEALTAPNGEIGLNVLKEEKPDLLLLDLILPKKDGFEVLEEKQKQPELKNIPVIVLTNLEEKFDVERAMSYGVRAYMVKADYKLPEIIEKVNEILKS